MAERRLSNRPRGLSIGGLAQLWVLEEIHILYHQVSLCQEPVYIRVNVPRWPLESSSTKGGHRASSTVVDLQ